MIELPDLTPKPPKIELLSKKEVLSLPRNCFADRDVGIYFLIRGRSIQYVGQTRTSILARVADHLRRLPKGSFKQYASIKSPHAMIEYVEALYIETFNPPLNKASPSPRNLLFLNSTKSRRPKVKDAKEIIDILLANRHITKGFKGSRYRDLERQINRYVFGFGLGADDTTMSKNRFIAHVNRRNCGAHFEEAYGLARELADIAQGEQSPCRQHTLSNSETCTQELER